MPSLVNSKSGDIFNLRPSVITPPLQATGLQTSPRMAQSQDLSVARAVFITGLLRSEPRVSGISRDDATLLARAILRMCNICTTTNIKVCTFTSAFPALL